MSVSVLSTSPYSMNGRLQIAAESSVLNSSCPPRSQHFGRFNRLISIRSDAGSSGARLKFPRANNRLNISSQACRTILTIQCPWTRDRRRHMAGFLLQVPSASGPITIQLRQLRQAPQNTLVGRVLIYPLFHHPNLPRVSHQTSFHPE